MNTNKIEIIKNILPNQDALKINGIIFVISNDLVGYTDKMSPICEKVIFKISPDFNRSACFTFRAGTIKGLIAKLNKLGYVIVKGY